MSTPVRITHIEDTTANIAANVRASMYAYDTTKDHLIHYRSDLTLRHIITADSVNNIINTLGNVNFASTKYIGLGPAAGRIVFTDATPDTIRLQSATFIIDDLVYIGTTDKSYAVPGYSPKVHILDGSGNPQLMLSYDSSSPSTGNSASFLVNSDGDLFVNAWTDGCAGRHVILSDAVSSSKVAIGYNAPEYGKLYVKATNVDVMGLNQTDDTKDFIDFRANSAGDLTKPITTRTSSNIVGHVGIKINGVVQWLAYRDNPGA